MLLYNLAVVLLLFSSLEGLITFWLNHPDSAPDGLRPALIAYYRNRDCSIIQYNADCARYDERLFYRLRSGIFYYSNREFDNEFQVNSQGFRDDEASLEYPQIIVLGDSYAMGWGVDQSKTYSEIVERKTGLKTLNTGVSSYGTVRELASLKNVKTDSVRYIFLQYCPNDYAENRSYQENHDSLIVSSKEEYQKTCEDHGSQISYYPFKHVFYLIQAFVGENPKRQAQKEPIEDQISVSEEDAFLNALIKSKDLPPDLPIYVFALDAEQIADDFTDRLRKLLASKEKTSTERNIHCLSMAHLIGKRERYVLDAHINTKGHRVLANELVKAIE